MAFCSAHTQDVGGPLARTGALLDIISGFDPADPATELMNGRPALQFQEASGLPTG